MTERVSEFIPIVKKESEKNKWKRERKIRERLERKQEEKLFKLFKDNEAVRHVYAIIDSFQGFESTIEIAKHIDGCNYEDVRKICRQLTDEWLLKDYYGTFYSRSVDGMESFHGHLRSYREREEGEYYRDAVDAVLKGHANETQKSYYKLIKIGWITQNYETALEKEIIKLRMDLKIALANPEAAKGLLFLKAFDRQKTLRDFSNSKQQNNDETLIDQGYEFCKKALTWNTSDFKETIAGISRAKRISQQKATLFLVSKLVEVYLKLYERKGE